MQHDRGRAPLLNCHQKQRPHYITHLLNSPDTYTNTHTHTDTHSSGITVTVVAKEEFSQMCVLEPVESSEPVLIRNNMLGWEILVELQRAGAGIPSVEHCV